MFRSFKSKVLLFALLCTLLTTLTIPVYAAPKPKPNKPPVIAQGDVITINTTTGKLTASDPEKSAMIWNASAPIDGGQVTISKPTVSKGTSTITYAYNQGANVDGTDSFVITVTDSNGAKDSITINISIKPVVIEDEYLDYVALGDSIATGTVYPGKSITSFVSYFKNFLITENSQKTVRTYNLANDGDRTNELYAKLLGNSNFITAVKDAEVITITIGGNNLMQAAKDPNALGGYDFFKINSAVAEEGLRDFQLHWTAIISRVKELNSKAKIIVTTTYNPYNVSDLYLHNTVDGLLTRSGTGLNDIIINNSHLGYKVANVFEAFDGYSINNRMVDVTYLYPRDLWELITRSPHPRALGQNIIFDLCKAAYNTP